MDINVRQRGSKWRAEVWETVDEMAQLDVTSEEKYAEINQWCINTLGYHARTAYHVFDFNKRSDLDWFLLRWT
jgi:hypothetical protein